MLLWQPQEPLVSGERAEAPLWATLPISGQFSARQLKHANGEYFEDNYAQHHKQPGEKTRSLLRNTRLNKRTYVKINIDYLNLVVSRDQLTEIDMQEAWPKRVD